jgi:3-dehydroquinate synthase
MGAGPRYHRRMTHLRTLELVTGGGPTTVAIGGGGLAELPRLVASAGLALPAAVVTNTTVGPLYGRTAAETVAARSYLELPDGEAFKRWPQVETVCSEWLAEGVHRREVVLAVGGGVVTDTAGFAASVFLRGLPWVAVPTSLLAMVDASVGGKTGVNLEQGKNLVGTFWQPRLVLADTDCLGTLPEREIRAGLAEVVKAAWIGDHELLDLVPGGGLASVDWPEIVERAVRVKARIVQDDEREAGPRQALNLGHTLGHALEAVTGYERFLHGEAVVWGLRCVLAISRGRGLLSDDAAARLEGSLRRLEPLPDIRDLGTDAVMQAMLRDKKADAAGIAWVLPTDDGVLLGQRVFENEIRPVFEAMRAAPVRVD